jgi:hypothetical protein
LGLLQIVKLDQCIELPIFQKAPQQVPKIASDHPIQTGAPAFSCKSSSRGRSTSKATAAEKRQRDNCPLRFCRLLWAYVSPARPAMKITTSILDMRHMVRRLYVDGVSPVPPVVTATTDFLAPDIFN